MDSGTVTYHNTKLCRYDRCDKDRLRIKELEKSKTERNNVDFFAEMKGNERRIIERKRRNRKTEMDNTTLYDPMLDDLKTTKLKLKREGDEQSGLDQAVAALEGLSFSSEQVAPAVSEDVDLQPPQEDPLWVQEANSRSLESSEKVRFLRERGYSSDDAKGAIDPTQSHVYALSKLWNQGTVPPSKEVTPELIQARQEEKEVLLAIFGEDDDSVKFSNDETLLDSVFPITSYEPPERYGLPPPLLLEVYLDHGISAYPNEPPVLAVIGGGLSEALLLELTNRLRPEAQTRAEEEAGDPQIFNLLTFLGEEVEKIVEEETAALQVIQKQKREQARKARAEAAKKRAEEEAQEKKEDALPTSFQSEMERRAYAQEVLSKGADYAKVEDGAKAQGAGVKRYNTGVSDQSLIEDLFG